MPFPTTATKRQCNGVHKVGKINHRNECEKTTDPDRAHFIRLRITQRRHPSADTLHRPLRVGELLCRQHSAHSALEYTTLLPIQKSTPRTWTITWHSSSSPAKEECVSARGGRPQMRNVQATLCTLGHWATTRRWTLHPAAALHQAVLALGNTLAPTGSKPKPCPNVARPRRSRGHW